MEKGKGFQRGLKPTLQKPQQQSANQLHVHGNQKLGKIDTPDKENEIIDINVNKT